MKTIQTAVLALAAILSLATPSQAQLATMTSTSLSSAVTSTITKVIPLASMTNVTAPGLPTSQGGIGSNSGNAAVTLLMVDNEAMRVASVTSTAAIVERGYGGTEARPHAANAIVWVGPAAYFASVDPSGYCVASQLTVSPRVVMKTGHVWTCKSNNQWGRQVDFMAYVPPTQCTFAPTTLTTTNTFVLVGGVFAVNGVSNAAAGTNTLTCYFTPDTRVTTLKGATIVDIVSTIGSQTVAPTSLGTSTLGSITFAAPTATTETPASQTPVAIGGTVTTVGPTTSVTSVTTAGQFLTFKHTYSTTVDLSVDRMIINFTFPFLQSASSAMTLNSAGLLVHYTGVDEGQ